METRLAGCLSKLLEAWLRDSLSPEPNRSLNKNGKRATSHPVMRATKNMRNDFSKFCVTGAASKAVAGSESHGPICIGVDQATLGFGTG